MPQAHRASAFIARRPAIRAAALLWIAMTVLLAPVGTTVHALSHLRPPAAEAPPQGDADDADASRHAAHRGAAAHCHVCDEWQALGHGLPSTPLGDFTTAPVPVPRATPARHRACADTPWILPRAPPRPH